MISASTASAMHASRLLPAMLPVRSYIRARFVEVDMLIDVVDPRHRDEVMMLAIGRTLFGQLDLVGSFQMVDFSDRLFVRRDDVHVFRDL
jgi:hypothetical protein